MVVEADSEMEATDAAESQIESSGTDGCDVMITATEVADVKDLEEHWRDSLPFNGVGDDTCEKILTEAKKPH